MTSSNAAAPVVPGVRLTKVPLPLVFSVSSSPCDPASAPFFPVENTTNAAVSVLTTRDAQEALVQTSRPLGRQLMPFAFRFATDVKCGAAGVPAQPVTPAASA